MTDKLLIPIASLDRRLAYPHNKPGREKTFDGSVLLQTYSVPLYDASLNKFNGHTKKAQLVVSNVRSTDQALQNYWWFADISGSNYVFDSKPNSATSSYGDGPMDISFSVFSSEIETNNDHNAINERVGFISLHVSSVLKELTIYEPPKPLLDSYSSSTVTHDLSELNQLLNPQ